MKWMLLLVLLMITFSNISAQHADIEGDTKILGKLDLRTTNDDNSIIIGRDAGLNDIPLELIDTVFPFDTFIIDKANIYLGPFAGKNSSNSTENIFIGRNAGSSNESGNRNVFIGSGAGQFDPQPIHNVFIGASAGSFARNSSYNVLIGHSVAFGMQDGINNVAVGSSTRLADKSENCTVLGALAGNAFDSLNNAIAIGYRSKPDCHNCAIIGGRNGQAVKMGLGTDNPEDLVSVHSQDNEAIVRIQSDPLDAIMQLGVNENSGSFLRTLSDNDLSFWTNNQKRLTVRNSGEITTSTALSVNTNDKRGLLTLRAEDDSTFGPNIFMFGESSDQVESGRLRFVEGTAATNWRGMFIHYDGSANLFHIGRHDSNSNATTDDENAISIRRTGNPRVEIFRTPDTHPLEVEGQASKTTAGSWVANSDSRLKKNISNLNSEKILRKVLSMQGVAFEWADNITGYKRPEGIQTGFIAQDIQEIWPEKISMDSKGYLMTAYGDYDPMFVEAFKAQQEMITALQSENEKYKTELELIRKEMNQISAQLSNGVSVLGKD